MHFLKLSILIFLEIYALINLVSGHGMLMDPIGRASRWRKDRSAPANYDDNGVNCGGFGTQASAQGECGLCGDNYFSPAPRPHELGGKYGQGVIVKKYDQRLIWVGGKITANHLGYYYVDICNLDKFKTESEECFAEHGPLMLIEGTTKYNVGRQTGWVNSSAVIPPGFSCSHCVFRWTYRAGNNWGICEDGRGTLGCGAQETFRSCADISIQPTYDSLTYYELEPPNEI